MDSKPPCLRTYRTGIVCDVDAGRCDTAGPGAPGNADSAAQPSLSEPRRPASNL